MAELRIRVVAVADRSLAVAYRPLIDAAERARRQLSNSGSATTRQAARDADAHVRAYEKSEREKVKAAERTASVMARIRERSATMAGQYAAREASAVARAHERATRDRLRENERILRDVERTEAAATRAAERGAAARARAEERSLKAARRASLEQDSRIVGAAVGAARGTARAALGISKELARGAGVQLDFGSHVKAGVDLEKNAVDLVNAGYMPGKAGAAGQRQSADVIAAEVRRAAIGTGNESGSAMEGLQAFVGKTGDLETGRAVLFDLAKLSKATGADLGDMVNAAGDVANALGDIPNKGPAVLDVMKAIAAQGKEGAVEIKDLASQMAKLGASSSQFTGDSSSVMAQMGALAQMTRAKGGAASATQAATSVSSFTNTFSKGARLDAFKAFGVDIRGADGKIDVRKAIFGAIQSASSEQHGGMANFDRNMGKMFMDVRARSVTKGFETIFKEAGGGEAGLKAAMKAFDDLSAAVVNNTEIEQSFGLAMQTTDAKAKVFNEQLGAMATEMRSQLMPVLVELAPVILSTIKSFGELATWIAEKTGVAEKKRRTAEVGTENQATNALSDLKADLATASFDQKHVTEARTQRAALAAAIARKQQDVEKEGNTAYATGPGALAPVKKLSDMNEKELAYAASLSGTGVEDGDRARLYMNDKQQLERMSQTLGQLDTTLENSMRRALEGSVLDVNVKNDPTFWAIPSLGDHGRQAPPNPYGPPVPPRMRGPLK